MRYAGAGLSLRASFKKWTRPVGKRNAIAIELSADKRQPIFLDLASSIIREIERGRLRPGDALPGTRALAKSLKLNRNTVDAAFHELTMQGWLVAEPARGTFVARDLPDIQPPGRRARNQVREVARTGKGTPPQARFRWNS